MFCKFCQMSVTIYQIRNKISKINEIQLKKLRQTIIPQWYSIFLCGDLFVYHNWRIILKWSKIKITYTTGPIYPAQIFLKQWDRFEQRHTTTTTKYWRWKGLNIRSKRCKILSRIQTQCFLDYSNYKQLLKQVESDDMYAWFYI